MRDSAASVIRHLRKLADPERAKSTERFFKTGQGEYGAGDRFLGLTVPQIRQLAGECRGLELDEIAGLLQSRWHEARLLAVIMLGDAYRRGDARAKQRIYNLYLRRTDRINNWDLVDVSAPAIVGAHLLRRSRDPLRRLARSKNLWERRIAVIATQHFIRHDDFGETLRLAKVLLRDEHDLMHKAVGWMLREIGNRDERILLRFLDRHAGAMPRTALRYAIERLLPSQRKRYMSMPRHSPRSPM